MTIHIQEHVRIHLQEGEPGCNYARLRQDMARLGEADTTQHSPGMSVNQFYYSTRLTICACAFLRSTKLCKCPRLCPYAVTLIQHVAGRISRLEGRLQILSQSSSTPGKHSQTKRKRCECHTSQAKSDHYSDEYPGIPHESQKLMYRYCVRTSTLSTFTC